MATRARTSFWLNLSRWRRQRRVQNAATLGLVLLGPVLVLATFLALGPLDQAAGGMALRLILLAMVAALRETSVMFAMLIGVFVLGERAGLWRWVSAGLILSGVVLMRI